MLQNPCKTLGFMKNMVYKIPPGGGGKQYPASGLGLELAIDPPPPRGNFVHYDFLILHYIRHKIKDVSPLRVAAITCNITLYTLPPQNSIRRP